MAAPARIPDLDAQTRCRDAAPRVVAARLAAVQREAAAAAMGDVEAVHQMRVAVRRLRAALKLFDRGGTLARVEKAAKALQDALGEVRDLQLWLAWLGSGPRGPVVDALEADARRRLGRGLRALGDALRAWEEEGRARLERPAPGLGGPGRLGGHRTRRRLEAALARAAERKGRLGRRLNPREAHRARIAMKRLRYLAELLEPAFARDAVAIADAAAKVQSALGDVHDGDVRLDWLKEARRHAKRSARPAFSPLLLRAEEERGEAARRARKALGKLKPKALRRRVEG